MFIRVRLLGTAAGGGLPQWNCACSNCQAARAGRIPSRTQSSFAISARPGRWFLVNASPDLRNQIASLSELQPSAETPRNSPMAGVFLTNADLDHVLGLYLLREGGRVEIFTGKNVRKALTTRLGVEAVLNAFCGVVWHEPRRGRGATGKFLQKETKETKGRTNFAENARLSGNGPQNQFQPVLLADKSESGMSWRAIGLPGKAPVFAENTRGGGEHSFAFQFRDDRTGGILLAAPDVAAVTEELQGAMEGSDAVLFDGTFWSRDELMAVKTGARSPEEMGHVTIKDGSLKLLGKLKARHKILVHINNTNPVLAENSPERAAVERAGITVGEDGMEFEL